MDRKNWFMLQFAVGLALAITAALLMYLPRKMLSRSGLGILAHGIGHPWTRPDSYFESAQEEVIVRRRLGD
jgi:hypothetical protein